MLLEFYNGFFAQMLGLIIFLEDYMEERRRDIILIKKAFGSVAHDSFQSAQ